MLLSYRLVTSRTVIICMYYFKMYTHRLLYLSWRVSPPIHQKQNGTQKKYQFFTWCNPRKQATWLCKHNYTYFTTSLLVLVLHVIVYFY